MKKFISHKIRSINHQLYCIKKIRKSFNFFSCKMLVTFIVLSVFDYCNSLLCHSPISTLKPLIALQRYAVRIIYDIPHRAYNNHISITSLMCDRHWLPVNKRIVYKLLTLMHAAIHYGTPDYVCLLISVIQQHRSLRSRHIFRVKAIEFQHTVILAHSWNME